MDGLLEKHNAVIKALTLSAILERGSAPLPLKIRQDVMLLSQGHTRLVTTKSTQGIPIPILNSATALLRGRGGEGQAGKGEPNQMPQRNRSLRCGCHPATTECYSRRRKDRGANKENACNYIFNSGKG